MFFSATVGIVTLRHSSLSNINNTHNSITHVSVCVCGYIYIYTHIHTHTYITLSESACAAAELHSAFSLIL